MRIGERVLPRGIILATALAAVALAGCPRVPETQPPPPTPIAASGEPRPSDIEAETPRTTSTSKVKPKPRKVVTVDATNKNGAPTGIALRRGESLNFQASGTWCMGIGECGGPDGIRPAGRGEEDIVVKGEKIGTLAARIGDSIVPIGSNAAMISEKDKDEEVVLFMNDRLCCYHDNSGSVTVSIFDSKEMSSWIEETIIKPAQQAARPAEAPKPPQATESRAETGWTRFKSFDLPYQVDYPSNWRQIGNMFYGDTNKANPTLFQVTSTPIADWITLDDFKDQVVKQLVDTVKALGAGIDLKQSPNQTIGGQKAWRFDSTVSSSLVTPNVSVLYLTIKDKQAWSVQYAADASVFNQELPKFQRMVASFKFLR